MNITWALLLALLGITGTHVACTLLDLSPLVEVFLFILYVCSLAVIFCCKRLGIPVRCFFGFHDFKSGAKLKELKVEMCARRLCWAIRKFKSEPYYGDH